MKRLLFFPGHRILAYEWERGRFRRLEAFEPDDAGCAAFRAWLEEAPRTPVQLLLDVIEEEFHVDRVPHVIGRERAALYRRTAEKHFRNTAFRYIVGQGRETTGRRDDRVLIAGLTNPEILKVWLSVIEAAAVPLKGVLSLPLVGERLLPYLGAAKSQRVLVISQQVRSTLRQSYYERGRLRFSRLVPGRYSDDEGYVSFLQNELDHTLHFLESHHFRRRDEPLDVFVIAAPAVYPLLWRELSSSAAVSCHVVPLDELARRVGIRGDGDFPGSYADTVFAQVLLRQQRPGNHYGLARLRRNFFVQRARVGLRVAAAACVAAAVAVGAGIYVRGRAYEAGVEAARERAARFERLYQRRLRQLDAFEYRAIDVKSAVDLMSQLDAAVPDDPSPTMVALGRVLVDHPNLVVDGLTWRVAGQPTQAAQLRGEAALRPARPLVAAAADDGSGYGYYGLVRGDVVRFGGDYRRAVELFEAFVGDLRAAGPFTRVQVVAAPFDLEPDAGVSGDSGTTAGDRAAKRAAFEILVQRGGGDGAD